MKLGLKLGLEYHRSAAILRPGLTLSASSVPENSAQGTDIATLTATNASNPGAVSIASQEVANLFQVSTVVPSFVGQKATKGTLVGTSVSLDLTTLSAGTLAENDIVVGVFALGANADWSPSITTSGYTILTNTRSDDSNDAHLLVGIKRMGATPDTVLDFANTSAATSAYNAVAYVIRGVDEATALSVASTLAQGTNTAIPNPGAIDPGVEGSLIVVVAANAHQLGVAPGALSASYLSNVFTDTADSAGRDGSVLIGTLPWDGVGAYDPAAITWDQADNITDSWVTLTIAFRPAVSMLQVGSGAAGLNYEVRTSATVTLQYTDDAGVHQSVKTISITDVADGPTITGAASDLATELAALTVDVETTFDLRTLVFHPLSQTMTFEVNFGAVDVDGFTFAWTPSFAEYLAFGQGNVDFLVTVTDEDSQVLEILEEGLSIQDVNEAPQYSNTSLVFEVPEGSAPAISSAVPADNATDIAITADPSVTYDKPVLFAATGSFTSRDVTGAADKEVFDLSTDVGSGAGQIELTAADTVTMHMTSDFANNNAYATQWSAGAVTNLGGIGVAALSDTTTLNFTTVAAAGMTLVGRNSQSGTSANLSTDLTALTGGIASSPSSGDLIKVWSAASAATNLTFGIDALNSETYVDIQESYVNDSNDINFCYAERVSDGTETAVITGGSTTNTRGSVAYVEVWRGVDNTTPQDVANVPGSGANTALANPGAITPVTSGARIFAAYSATQPGNTTATPTGPANMTEFNYIAAPGTNASVVLGVASEPWTSGAFDPDAWTGVTDDISQSHASSTSAQRPA